MIEQHLINGKDVWIKVDAHPVRRENPNVIPTEYFTASYFFEEPIANSSSGEAVEEDNKPKLFESPVEALTFARKMLEAKLG